LHIKGTFVLISGSCCFWCWPIRKRYEVYSCASNHHGATLYALFYLLGACISVCPMLVEQMNRSGTIGYLSLAADQYAKRCVTKMITS